MGLLVALLALNVAPGPRREAARLARQAVREYNIGDFTDALADLKHAYLLDPVPALLFNLGQCQRALGQWKEAAFSFRGYLREAPGGSHRAQAAALLAETETKLAAQPTATGIAPPALAGEDRVGVERSAPASIPHPASSASRGRRATVRVPAAIATPAPPHRRGPRPLALALGAGGVACGVVAAIFGAELAAFESVRGGLARLPPGTATNPSHPYAQLRAAQGAAQADEWLAAAFGLLGAAGLTGMALTW